MMEEKLLKYKEELQGIASLRKDNEHSYRTPLQNLKCNLDILLTLYILKQARFYVF